MIKVFDLYSTSTCMHMLSAQHLYITVGHVRHTGHQLQSLSALCLACNTLGNELTQHATGVAGLLPCIHALFTAGAISTCCMLHNTAKPSALGSYSSWFKCACDVSSCYAVPLSKVCCCLVPVLWITAKSSTCVCRSTGCMRLTSSTCQSAVTLTMALTAYGPTCNGFSPMQSKFVSGCSQQARPNLILNESLYLPMIGC